MMEPDDVIKESEEMVRQLQKLTSLKHWDVQLTFDESERETMGTCQVEGQYERVRINITPSLAKDRLTLARTVAHEFAHILIDPISVVVSPWVKKRKKAKKLFAYAEDAVATSLERVLVKHLGESA